MRTLWTGVPAEVRPELEDLVRRYEPLLPRWVEIVSVHFTEGSDIDTASVTTNVEYRQVKLYVHPCWLTEDTVSRRTAIIHEFVHVPIEQLRDVFDRLTASISDEGEPLRLWAVETWRHAMESTGTDLEHGIDRLCHPNEPEGSSV